MDILTAGFFDRLINVSGFCLWGITILYLMHQKRKTKKGDLKKRKSNAVLRKSFEEEVYGQWFKHQSEYAFKRIHRTLRREIDRLNQLIENGDFERVRNQGKYTVVDNAPDVTFEVCQGGKELSWKKPKDSYAEVIRLWDQGVSVRKISEKVEIPKGEIEMLIKLRKKKLQSRKRQSAFAG